MNEPIQFPRSFEFKGKLWYVGLEAYESRYTLQLTEWNERAFKALDVNYEVVRPAYALPQTGAINIGQVLDGAGRPVYAMGQIQTLLGLLRDGTIRGKDTLFFEDMFHPGIEGLPYLLDQMPEKDRPKIFVRCLAQTIDPDDFVHVTNMARWMRHSEQAILKFVDGVMVASHEMLAHMTAAGWDCQCFVTGLPFDRHEVRERVDYVPPEPTPAIAGGQLKADQAWRNSRKPRVVFAARTDQEKQPEFFIELARRWRANRGPDVDFLIVSGKALSSNNPSTLKAIKDAMSDGVISLSDNLTKEAYYTILKTSRVLFNCALQDWVSNTVSEADALGCNVLYPAYRSFVETFNSDHTRLYVPWSLFDASEKLARLLHKPHPKIGQISGNQSQTIWKTLAAMANYAVIATNPLDPSYRRQETRDTWNLENYVEGANAYWSYAQPTDTEILW